MKGYRDQVSLPILREFKQINGLLVLYHMCCDDFIGNRSQLILQNLLNIINKIQGVSLPENRIATMSHSKVIKRKTMDNFIAKYLRPEIFEDVFLKQLHYVAILPSFLARTNKGTLFLNNSPSQSTWKVALSFEYQQIFPSTCKVAGQLKNLKRF